MAWSQAVTADFMAGDKLVTKNREFTDWTAEIIQHMIDHSKGKLV